MIPDSNVIIKVALTIQFLLFCISCRPLITSGPAIRVSENGRYFVDAAGHPFFWQGDTEWELFHLFTPDDAREFMDKRKAQGFNVIQVMATGVFPEWGRMQGIEPWKAREAWVDNNPLSPDEQYFLRADSIVSTARELELILVVGIYHARDCDAGRITVQNAKPWAKWLTGRYKNEPNIVWSMYPHAVPESEEIIRLTVEGIMEGDGRAHLTTMHPDPSPKSSSFMHNESWLSFNTLQTWDRGFMNYEMVRADYERAPVKPVVNGEARYEEEDGTTSFEARRPGYWSVLAGGFYSYGHCDNWKSPATWRDWYSSPGALQMKVMGEFFRSVEWWKLVPDQEIFTQPVAGNAAARSEDGTRIVAYLTRPDTVSIRLDRLTVSPGTTAWWIDPRSGDRTRLATLPATGSHKFMLPADWEDAVLLIEASTD